MNTLQQGVIALIHSAISGQAKALPDAFDLSEIRDLTRKHQIENLIYYGAVNCGIDPQLEQMRELFMVTCKYLHIDQRQRQQLTKLMAAFDQARIDYMPLKGVLLKRLYPKPDMRIMGDADILIRLEQYEKIKPLLPELGYEEVTESDHELIWKTQGLLLELHKRLIPSYNYDYAAYFGDGWSLAKPCQEGACRYEMTKEDEWVYLFTHFAKHYRDGGIGIRHFADLYIYRQKTPALDEAYILEKLRFLQLDVFYQNICTALAYAFEGGTGNDATERILATIFHSGVFGTQEQHVVASGVREKAQGNTVGKMKRSRWLQLTFPPYEAMCEKYPVLRKWAILLPVMWLVRWVNGLLHKRKTIHKESQRSQLLTEIRVQTYEQALQAVGLAFHFEE